VAGSHIISNLRSTTSEPIKDSVIMIYQKDAVVTTHHLTYTSWLTEPRFNNRQKEVLEEERLMAELKGTDNENCWDVHF
jgi:hypothetical protein